MPGRLQERWARRTAAPRPQRVESVRTTTVRGRTPEQVWAFVQPAETAVLTQPTCVRAFTVPGTGPGVGEQQCHVLLEDGREVPHLTTVVALEDGVWAETRSEDSPHPSGGRTEVAAVAGGTALTFTSWVEVPGALVIDRRATQAGLDAHGEQYLGRVKAILESPLPPGALPSE